MQFVKFYRAPSVIKLITYLKRRVNTFMLSIKNLAGISPRALLLPRMVKSFEQSLQICLIIKSHWKRCMTSWRGSV